MRRRVLKYLFRDFYRFCRGWVDLALTPALTATPADSMFATSVCSDGLQFGVNTEIGGLQDQTLTRTGCTLTQ